MDVPVKNGDFPMKNCDVPQLCLITRGYLSLSFNKILTIETGAFMGLSMILMGRSVYRRPWKHMVRSILKDGVAPVAFVGLDSPHDLVRDIYDRP